MYCSHFLSFPSSSQMNPLCNPCNSVFFFHFPIKLNLCCPYTLGNVAIHQSLVELPGLMPLPKPTFCLPTTINCQLVFSQPGAGLPAASAFHAGILSGLCLLRSCANCHSCCEFSYMHCFLVTHCLWLLRSFCPLFLCHPRALGGGSI